MRFQIPMSLVNGSSALTRRQALGWGLACCGTAMAATTDARLERPRLSLAVGGRFSLQHLPLAVAEHLGYFKSEGLDVIVQEFPSAFRAQQAALSGGADLVAGVYEQTIALQDRNQYFQSFVLQTRAPQIAFGVSSRTLPGFQGVADLKGRKIGVSAPGSSTDMVVNLVLARAGLKPSDVRIIAVGNAQGALAAVRSGQIDALCNPDPVMTQLEQSGEVRVVADARSLKGNLELFGGSMPSSCLLGAVEFITRNPSTCQALAHALVRALAWLQQAGPGDVLKALPDAYLGPDRGLFLAAFHRCREAWSPDGMMPDDGPRTALQVLAGFDENLRPEKIELPKTFTNEFSRRARDRWRPSEGRLLTGYS